MKRSLVVFVMLALVAALFSTAMAAPRRGGTVVIGLFGDNETLNPILSESSSEREVLQAVFSSLYRTDQDTDFVPDLLTKMPTKKGLTYYYELRKGVKFSDGHELDSQDVKFTWECHMNPKIPVPTRSGFDEIKSFDIPTITYKGKDGKTYKTYDKYHFSITLKKVYARYDLLWADKAIVPKHILEKEIAENKAKNAPNHMEKGGKFSRNPIGSGPFILKEWVADNYIMVARNPNYFRAGQPYLDKIIWKIIPDSNAMLNQLKTGEIDVYRGIQANRYNEAVRIPGIKVFKIPAYIYNHIELNMNDPNDLSKPHPILADKRVRQALDYAYPREMIVETVLENVGYPAYSNLPPISWAYNKNVAKPHYDPEKAKKLLDEAGWVMGNDGYRYKNGRKLQLTFHTNAGNKTREQVGVICQEEWKKIGVDLVPKFIDFATLTGDIMDNRKFDCLMIAWISDADPDSKSLWHSSQIPSKENQEGQNYVGYRNPEMDKLMEDGLATDNIEARKKIYHRMQEILAEDVPYIFVNFYVDVDGIKEGLENFRSNPTTATFMWNCYEWYWSR